MKEEVQCSIIVPAFNAELTITRCIESVLAQSVSSWEMIVVNDGSQDGTEDLVKKFSVQDARIKLVNQNNKGRSAARNHGISIASGKWILFLDADDYLIENALSVLLNAGNGVDIVWGAYETSEAVYGSRGKECVLQVKDVLLAKIHPRLFSLKKNTCAVNEGVITSTVWGGVYLRKKILQYKIFFYEDLVFGEDFIFNCLALFYLKKIKYIPSIVYHYDIDNSQTCRVYHERDSLALLTFAHRLRVFSEEYFGFFSDDDINSLIAQEVENLLNRISHSSECLTVQSFQGLWEVVYNHSILNAIWHTSEITTTSKLSWIVQKILIKFRLLLLLLLFKRYL